MSFISFTTNEMDTDKAIKSTTLHKIRNNLEWIYKSFAYNITDIPNKDFEFVTNGVPDLWDCTTFEGGYAGVSTFYSLNGQYSLLLVHDGSTRSGGKAICDYIPVSTNVPTDYYLAGQRWGDPVKMVVAAQFYLSDFTSNGASVLISSTLNGSTTPALRYAFSSTFQVPANTRWVKIRIQNSTAAGDTAAGDIYVDALRFYRR
jgi:hypothetical protein